MKVVKIRASFLKKPTEAIILCSTITLILTILIGPTTSITLNYGQHFPNGLAAVDYIYGPDGMWKTMTSLNYKWNYYEQWATPSHPYDKGQLIEAANGSLFFTARDANGYLLCDSDRDLELDEGYCGFAFHEHSAKGSGGESRGNPFTQFWLDDNWLASYMSQAYFRDSPDGLTNQNAFMRWRIIGGDPAHWELYNSTHFDTLALDGLYFLAVGDANLALGKWDESLALSEYIFDEIVGEYTYPGIHENYHMGLWAVLTEFILEYGKASVSEEKLTEIIQHSVSLHSNILRNQETDGNGNSLGWTSNIGGGTSLINSESISCGVLGLGANSRFVFESSKLPMNITVGNNYIVRENYIVSAVMGVSIPGILSFGPNIKLQPGAYRIVFVLRASRPNSINWKATIDIYDSTIKNVIHEKILYMEHFIGKNLWSRISIDMVVGDDEHLYEFRTHWHGNSNLDIAVVRVQDRKIE